MSANAHFLRRNRRYALNESAVALDPLAVDWVARVVRNGGAIPTLSTQMAVSIFSQGLMASGLRPKMISLSCFAPDSLAAALTPLMGGLIWINHNFIAGDLSINGLVGNGSTKFIDTGIVGTNNGSDTSAGITIYITNASPTGTYDCGYTNNAGSDTEILAFNDNGGNKASFLCWNNTVGQGATSASWTPAPGYLSGNRTGASAAALYFASSTNTHSALATTATTGGTRSAHNLYIGCTNAYELGGAFGFTSNRYSFAAIHDGLSAAESTTFFALVQALRKALGGGFI